MRDSLADFMWEFAHASSAINVTHELQKTLYIPEGRVCSAGGLSNHDNLTSEALNNLEIDRLLLWSLGEYNTLCKTESRGSARKSVVRKSSAEMSHRNAARAICLALDSAYSR